MRLPGRSLFLYSANNQQAAAADVLIINITHLLARALSLERARHCVILTIGLGSTT
jgi:hypothetical protein